jgi:hypothetical protein
MVCRDTRIKIHSEKECKLEVFTDRLQLSDGTWTKTLPVGSIVRMSYRGMLHRPHGIDIFVEMAPSVLLAFDDGKCLEVLRPIAGLPASHSTQIQTAPSLRYFRITDCMHKWQRG